MDYVVVAFSDEDLAKGKVTVYWVINLINVPPPPPTPLNQMPYKYK